MKTCSRGAPWASGVGIHDHRTSKGVAATDVVIPAVPPAPRTSASGQGSESASASISPSHTTIRLALGRDTGTKKAPFEDPKVRRQRSHPISSRRRPPCPVPPRRQLSRPLMCCRHVRTEEKSPAAPFGHRTCGTCSHSTQRIAGGSSRSGGHTSRRTRYSEAGVMSASTDAVARSRAMASVGTGLRRVTRVDCYGTKKFWRQERPQVHVLLPHAW